MPAMWPAKPGQARPQQAGCRHGPRQRVVIGRLVEPPRVAHDDRALDRGNRRSPGSECVAALDVEHDRVLDVVGHLVAD